MSRWNAYLKTTSEIVETYKGELPLSHWLKDFFRKHKKMGSSDRRIISSIVYQYYRTCKVFAELPFPEHALAARLLCMEASDQLLQALRPEWNEHISLSLEDKKLLLADYYAGKISFDYFPFADSLSSGLDYAQLNDSFIRQPDLFLRVRPGKMGRVLAKLQQAGIVYRQLADCCLAIPNQSKIETIVELNAEAVVQDYSSQRVGDFFGLLHNQSPVKVWDCCAASGGKSIMAYDLSHNIDLTVSDIRQSILENLRRRFREAGIRFYQALRMDLTENIHLPNESFDLIIADLPCSGSGTWSRTPEQLCFFQQGKIEYYSNLQKSILRKVVPKLKRGGRLVYITCSVFRAENEEVAEFADSDPGLTLDGMHLLTGYDQRADSMFVAVLSKA